MKSRRDYLYIMRGKGRHMQVSSRSGLISMGLPALLISASLTAGLTGCADTMHMHKPEQGLYGKFSVYGPPHVLQNCTPMVIQADKDSCRKQNERIIEEPFQGTISVKNLGTGEGLSQVLDGQGAYRLVLTPGEYEVCVGEECSDPLEVRMGIFSTYGQRLPRAANASDSAQSAQTAKAGAKRAAPGKSAP